MASRRAQGPAEGHDQKAGRPAARPSSAASTRARGKHGKNPKDVERARVALVLSEGNVQRAAKATGIPRTNIRRWIADGEFDQDAWDKIRDERKREAIELAWEGVLTQLRAAQQVPHQVFLHGKSGEIVDAGPNPHAASQIAKAQVEVMRVLGGTGVTAAAADGENTGDQTVRIEIVPPAWPDYDASGKIIPFRRTG